MNTDKPIKTRSPWTWIPSLYFAEGLPYTVVMLIAVVFYKRMGIGNAEIALYTSWLYLPWVIKPLWSPIVDIFKTKRFWIVSMQLLIGAGLGGVVLTIPMPAFFQFTLGFFWLMAFSSATHDIAADGFYMLGLSSHDQAKWVGLRSTFWRMAMILGQGGLIIFAGMVESSTGLDDLGVVVKAGSKISVEQRIDDIPLRVERMEGATRIKVLPEKIGLSLGTQSFSNYDSIKTQVEYWNGHRGEFDDAKSMQDIAFSNHLIPDSQAPVGKTVLAYIVLSGPPDEDGETVVTLGHDSGDKSIKLVSDTRLVFTRENWDVPYLVLLQVHPNLKQASQATFMARSGNIRLAWSLSFLILSVIFVFFFIYHYFMLPHPAADKGMEYQNFNTILKNFLLTFVSYFTKEKIGLAITFILIYRFGEAQLVKIAPLFMLDSVEAGGIGLTTQEYGFIYTIIGAIMLTLGGIIGGFVASRNGLKYWIFWMALAMKLPDIVYVYLAYAQPDNIALVAALVGIEQFGYGFGFTAFMLYMITVAEGEHKTAHYAICTGFMALGMMIPGMFSGWLQETIGYQLFFIWVLIATVPGLILLKFLPIDPEFGKKASAET